MIAKECTIYSREERAADGEAPCKTRYPLVLVHGLFMRDDQPGGCWGHIADRLQSSGAAVFFGGQDAVGCIETNAEQLKQAVLGILKETGAQKVNLIAHSKGGLDARYMISCLNMHAAVASLTTVATPHRGTDAAAMLLKWPWILRGAALSICNRLYGEAGDRNPNIFAALTELTPDSCRRFNRRVPNHPEVMYQSYGCRMACAGCDWRLFLPHFLINGKAGRGEDDGLVTLNSAAWAYYRGLVPGSVKGVSHWNAIDWHLADFCKKCRGKKSVVKDPAFGVTRFYIRLAKELGAAGL